MSMSRHLSAFISHRLLNRRTLGAALLIAACSTAQAAEPKANDRWVSDSLNTFVRSGPTDGYRIVGTLKSGQKVELINTQGDYSQVRGEGQLCVDPHQ